MTRQRRGDVGLGVILTSIPVLIGVIWAWLYQLLWSRE